MKAGLNLIICSADITAMRVKLSEDVRSPRQTTGGAPPPS